VGQSYSGDLPAKWVNIQSVLKARVGIEFLKMIESRALLRRSNSFRMCGPVDLGIHRWSRASWRRLLWHL